MSTPAQLAQAAFLQAAFLTDPRVQAILAMLNSDGEAARVIGGAVRNALLGLADKGIKELVALQKKSLGL